MHDRFPCSGFCVSNAIRPSVAVCLVCLCVCPGVSAQEKHEDEIAFLLVIFDIPSQVIKMELSDAIRAQTGDLSLEITFIEDEESAHQALFFSMEKASALAEKHDADFVFFIRQNDAGRLAIHVFERINETMMVKEVITEDESSGIQVETAAIMVRSYLKLLAEGAHIGISPPAAQEKREEEAGKKKPGPKHVLEILFSYHMDTLAREKPLVHGISAGLGFSPSVFKNVYFELGYKMSSAFSVGDNRVHMEVSHHPFVLGIRYQFIHKKLRMLPGVSVLLEYVRKKVITPGESYGAAVDSSALNVALTPSIRFSLGVLENFDLFLQVGMDIYLRRQDYIYEIDGNRYKTISPWFVGFNLLGGMAVNVL